jgi:hypothetical protein
MLKKSFDKLVSEKPSQLILGIIFVLYILLNVQTPAFLAGSIDTIFGKVIVVAIAAVIFMKTNPVIGVLGLVVAYQMIKTASVTTGTYGLRHYLPSENSKMQEMQSFNTEIVAPVQEQAHQQEQPQMHAITNVGGDLEVQTVSQMAPLVINDSDSGLNYSPVLDSQHSAASLHEL